MVVVYILAGLVGLFILLQFSQILLAGKSKGLKVQGLQGELKALEKNGSKGLVYFHSPSCHACKTITPVIREMKNRYSNIFDIDISKDQSALRAFGIKATPTTMKVENGIVTEVLLGARSKEVLEKLVTWE